MPNPPFAHTSGLPLALGLLGFPLGHTLSPLLHQAFLKKTGLNGFYNAIETPAIKLEETLNTLKEQGYRGWNVTIPHKITMLGLVDKLSEEAEAIGAVNTVCHSYESGLLTGFNTDSEGFWRSLNPQQQVLASKGTVLVLGAGGASKAVVWALLKRAVSPKVVVAARKPELAQLQFKAMAAHYPNLSFLGLNQEALQELTPAEVSLVVNCTPVGMWPETQATPLPLSFLRQLQTKQAAVVDLIYKPAETLLLQEASGLGLSTQDGFAMLVHQAALAFELWTGRLLEPDFLATLIGQGVEV